MQKLNPLSDPTVFTSDFQLLPSDFAMPRKRSIKLRCPICKKPVKAGEPEFPFCSDRCRSIDLGKWASGEYRVSSPATDTEEAVRPDSEFDDTDS